jgi:ribonuclease-3
MSSYSLDAVQQTIGYLFKSAPLLEQALTHKSYANEVRDKRGLDNERLEFLGDAVLSLVISEYLAEHFVDLSEGELSKRKARLVSEASLAKIAERLQLGKLLRLGRGEELTQGREKPSILADACEALIAAIYLDGGLEPARAFIIASFAQELGEQHEADGAALAQDFKTSLQERCQKQWELLPDYVVVREAGPDHQKLFEVEVSVRKKVVGIGMGRTKKEAEQMAAKQALEQFPRVG